jgi:2-haloacid dehalogenase
MTTDHPNSPTNSPIDFGAFDVLTFDCYGTLIDWESGILTALRSILDARDIGPDAMDDESLLARYAAQETSLEAGPYRRYREVLGQACAGVCSGLGVEPSSDERASFADSVGAWPAFPDSPDALRQLHERFALAVITNCDDDLFAASNRRLGVDFDFVVTAQQVGAYKPSTRNFEVAFERIDRPRGRILHVAQSLFHDHVPAKSLGLTTVWINRRHDRPGSGATPIAEASPDLVAPDMATFAALAAPDR